ncbi:hypothetical protein [Colwellia sp. TT2012]|uniref:hypothetical protein n=1 Tax=Colwellia sp. TT2012 TaxID=1720342 RepID=UPI000708FA1B|nr:hypothetical protein [Colwellia sp. TT2012]
MSETTLRLKINVNNKRMFNNITKLLNSFKHSEAPDESIPKTILKPFSGWSEDLLNIHSINCDYPEISCIAIGSQMLNSTPASLWKLIQKHSFLCLAILDDSRSDSLTIKGWTDEFTLEYATGSSSGYDDELRSSVFEREDYFVVAENILQKTYKEELELMKLKAPFKEYNSNQLLFYTKSRPSFTKKHFESIKIHLINKGWNVHFTNYALEIVKTEPNDYIGEIDYDAKYVTDFACIATKDLNLNLDKIERGRDFIDANNCSKIITVSSIQDWVIEKPKIKGPDLKKAFKGCKSFLDFYLLDGKSDTDGQEFFSLLVQLTAMEVEGRVIEDHESKAFYLVPVR